MVHTERPYSYLLHYIRHRTSDGQQTGKKKNFCRFRVTGHLLQEEEDCGRCRAFPHTRTINRASCCYKYYIVPGRCHVRTVVQHRGCAREATQGPTTYIISLCTRNIRQTQVAALVVLVVLCCTLLLPATGLPLWHRLSSAGCPLNCV